MYKKSRRDNLVVMFSEPALTLTLFSIADPDRIGRVSL